MMKKLPIMAIAAAAVLGCGKETPAGTTGDGINPPPLPDETDVCPGIEDDNFKKYCLQHFDTDNDGKISRQEAELVKTIDCNPDNWNFSIASYKGIEYFTNLETFYSPYQDEVKTIDLHHNAKITNIPEQAFEGCQKLEKIVLPPNVTSIGDGAFADCGNLAGFYGNLASKDNRCLVLNGRLVGFAQAGLTSYSIPGNVTAIGTGVIRLYNSRSGLEELTIPDSVTSVEQAFYGFLNLKAIHGKSAPDNRCLIIDGKLVAFAPAGLTEYTVPKGVETVGEQAFAECSGLTSVTVSEGVTEIGANAFILCTSLAYVDIPGSITSIGDSAFAGCRELENVTVKATTPPALGSHVFGDGFDLGDGFSINVPESAVDAYRVADGWKDYDEYIKMQF